MRVFLSSLLLLLLDLTLSDLLFEISHPLFGCFTFLPQFVFLTFLLILEMLGFCMLGLLLLLDRLLGDPVIGSRRFGFSLQCFLLLNRATAFTRRWRTRLFAAGTRWWGDRLIRQSLLPLLLTS